MKNNLFLSFTALLITSSSFANDFYLGGGLDFNSQLFSIEKQSRQSMGKATSSVEDILSGKGIFSDKDIFFTTTSVEFLYITNVAFSGFIGYKVNPYFHAQINGSWTPAQKHTPSIFHENSREQTYKRWDVSFYLKGIYPFNCRHSLAGITGVGYFSGSRQWFNTASITDKTQSIMSYKGLAIPLGIEYTFLMTPQHAILISSVTNINLSVTSDIVPSSNGEIIGNNSNITFQNTKNFTKVSLQYRYSF